MSDLSRRGFIAGGAAIAAGIAAGPFQGFVAHAARPHKPRDAGGYGPLAPVADLRGGAFRLELPAGFQYRSFHPAGTTLDDGSVIGGRHDGMAAFGHKRSDLVTLIRNHEVNGPTPSPLGTTGAFYDSHTGGGTVTVIVDKFGNVHEDRVSLRGTQMNCAGGRTPWGSWLSCEETVNGPDVGPDFTGAPNTTLTKPHGYLFQVPTTGRSDAVPIKATGRFPKEAAAVTPSGDAIYITEDNFDFPSGLYRYLPPRPARATKRVEDGGVLQMFKVAGVNKADLSVGLPVGSTFAGEWVTIEDPDPTFPPGTTNNQAIRAVGDEGRTKGAAIFSRLEGCYYANGRIYFVSTQGGATVPPDVAPAGFGDGRGQVWMYDLEANVLQLLYESPGSATLDLPDNIVVSPRRGLVLCEDGSADNFLRGLSRDGAFFDLARNIDPDQVGQEFAGATFSPDGHTLYVNIQSGSGYSIAIWGPWERGPL